MTTPIGSIGSPVGTVGQKTGFSEGTASTSSSVTSNMDKDMFLKLLVAQMKYQDPSKPTDASQFIAQTAQFTLVEKMDALAKAQERAASSTQLQSATAMLGSTITWTGQDQDGKDVVTTGKVSGVSVSGGVATLLVDDTPVEVGAVTKVTKPN